MNLKTFQKYLLLTVTVASATLPLLIQPAFAAGCRSQSSATAQPSSVAATTNSLLEVAAANGNFTTLLAAVKAAGLEDTINSGTFTVFAPTDAAFAALPAGTVESLLQPENRDQLVTLLTRHVVSGKVTAAMLPSSPSVETVQGENLVPTVTKDGVKINDANVVQADVSASNGVIHVIDSVL